ncbi:hypothetical protein HYALB_00002815 [Hymenoscyphus albidus]|uniref:Alpha/beta hydrolase fold-3 domain-containing protein n=1 Tax=Hymenoscyphus albidus TaxID=595503 RepID=A0A9N9LDT2_9HELO|nr:hypothetical protein HYALB_00002815 [Hymenoscyphus albidus]
MDFSPAALAKSLLPRVPLLGKTAITHTLGRTEQSGKWDLRTALVTSLIRSYLLDSPPQAVSKSQKASLKDPGVKGRVWISKITMSPPAEDDIRRSIFHIIESMKESGEAEGGYREPEMVPVEAEWTGYRAAATKKSPELNISEEEKYKEMMKEVTSPTTILYFHGGAHYLMDPASHRPTCKKLAKITKGRCLSVRYRLAPQNPFPSALIDALVSYLTLLYPPPGSLQDPVLPENVVFAGDSAGGNLCLSLLQTILQFQRLNLRPLFHGSSRFIPLPAGCATASPWCDVTLSLPSHLKNAPFDYLPGRTTRPVDGIPYPPCEIWPSNPPRKAFYADDALLCHPLVSPVVAESWEGSCPIYIAVGQELLSDEGKHVAAKARRQGVEVVFEEFEAMPHCFAMIFEGMEGSKRFFNGWGAFIGIVSGGDGNRKVESKGSCIVAKTLKERTLDFGTLSELKDEEVKEFMREGASKMKTFEGDPLTASKL